MKRKRPGKTRKSRRSLDVVLAAGAALAVPVAVEAATYPVTNTNDDGAGSLRDAIEAANANPGPDIITFSAAATGTITLTTGQLEITDSVDIRGPGTAVLEVSGNDASRVFYIYHVSEVLEVTISGLTISNGNASEGPDVGGGIVNWGESLTLDDVEVTESEAFEGGGIFLRVDSHSTTNHVVIRDSVITGNDAGFGGGIFIRGYHSSNPNTDMTVTIENSEISYNYANYYDAVNLTDEGDGGGINIDNLHHAVTIINTDIFENVAVDHGGGIEAGLYGGTLTITGDSVIEGNYAYSDGGGIRINLVEDGGVVTIEQSTIRYNDTYDDGGGMAIDDLADGEVTIRDVTFENNTAYSEGGALFVNDIGSQGSLLIHRSTISHNVAEYDDGGGIAVDTLAEGASLEIRETTLYDNYAYDQGGGLYIDSIDLGATVTIVRSHIYENNAGNYEGGGIFVDALNGEMTISESTIENNTSNEEGGGIAVHDLYGRFTIERSTVSGNDTVNYGGGGLYVYYSHDGSYLTIENSTFSGNDAYGSGGGLYFKYVESGANVLLNFATIVDNDAGSYGGGIHLEDGGTVTIDNSIIANNYAGGPDDLYATSGTFDVSNSLVEDYADVNDLGGNIFDQDPDLGPLQDNGGPTETHEPNPGSPVIDAADSTGAPATDQRTFPRVVDGDDVDATPEADMGSVEVGAELVAGTVNFSSATYTVNESAGTLTVTVTRTGGSTGAASVDVCVDGGTATGFGVDYMFDGPSQCETITWADGESGPKSVVFDITNDDITEGDETIELELRNLSGVNPGTTTESTVTITEGLAVGDIPTADEWAKVLLAILIAGAGVAALGRGRFLASLFLVLLVLVSVEDARAKEAETRVVAPS